MNECDKGIVLLSGGLDSATTLAIARAEGRQCLALSFSYGQRCGAELEATRRIAAAINVAQHQVLRLAAFARLSMKDPIPCAA